MKKYYRVMLGRKSAFAEQCFAGNFIGADFGITEDLSHNLPDEWRAFNKRFIPVFLAACPEKIGGRGHERPEAKWASD